MELGPRAGGRKQEEARVDATLAVELPPPKARAEAVVRAADKAKAVAAVRAEAVVRAADKAKADGLNK